MVIAVAWYAAANAAIGLLSAWEPSPILGWILTIPLLLILVGGAIAMLLTLGVGRWKPLWNAN